MTCVVFGASGLIGRYLLPSLGARDMRVVAISRRERAAGAGVEWRRGRLPDAVPALPADVRTIVSLGPLDQFVAWFEQAGIAGVPVVAMSSMSAQSKRDSPEAGERELAARLRDAEERLLAQCAAAGGTGSILRATLIYGGPEGALEQLAARARRRHLFPLPRGRGLRQPVHAADLAAAALAAMETDMSYGVVQAGGGERLSASAMFTRLRGQCAPRTLAVPLPDFGLRVAARVGVGPRGAAQRLRCDLTADTDQFAGLIGASPRGFSPAPPRDQPDRDA